MNQSVMRPSSNLPEVFLYRDPIDFRKSFKGLAVLVEQELGHNPFDGHLYAFTGPVEEPSKMTSRNLMHDIKL